MTKTEIFEEVVSIMKNDASCCKDEPGANPSIYRAKITDDMDEESFLFAVQSYIASFHVKNHTGFFSENRGDLPFRVQRYQDALYITMSAPDHPLKVGDKIIKVDGLSVREYGILHEDMLYGEPEDRQGSSWFKLLTFAKEVTAIKAASGEEVTCPITLGNSLDYGEPYYCKRLLHNIAYMRLLDFADDVKITKMYQDNDDLLRSSEYLIIDVRGNSGGMDTAFLPLLEFCLPEGKTTAVLKDGIYDSGVEVLYSERNCNSRLKLFEEYLNQDGLPDETRTILTSAMEELREYRGKGFIQDSFTGSDELPYVGTSLPKKVYILTDDSCRSSGDAFVDTMRKSPKVTVVGRPTMGIMDFSDCTEVQLGDYTMFYPTSRNLYLDKGIQMRGNGVPVHIHIPWTPEHLKRDVDLDTVLSLIDKENT